MYLYNQTGNGAPLAAFLTTPYMACRLHAEPSSLRQAALPGFTRWSEGGVSPGFSSRPCEITGAAQGSSQISYSISFQVRVVGRGLPTRIPVVTALRGFHIAKYHPFWPFKEVTLLQAKSRWFKQIEWCVGGCRGLPARFPCSGCSSPALNMGLWGSSTQI